MLGLFALAPVAPSQEVYQRTHPVLFSDRAVYVVVYSLRAGASVSDLTRHLMNVAVRCKDAPILVVGTHSDAAGGGSPLPLAALKARFPQVCVVGVEDRDLQMQMLAPPCDSCLRDGGPASLT
jgi:hypothetical protein